MRPRERAVLTNLLWLDLVEWVARDREACACGERKERGIELVLVDTQRLEHGCDRAAQLLDRSLGRLVEGNATRRTKNLA